MSKITILLGFPADIWQLFVSYLPGVIGFKLRYRFWKKHLKFLGKNAKIDIGVYFQNPKYISLDEGCWIDRNVIILAGPPGKDRITYEKANSDFTLSIGEVYVGKFTHIAPYCVLSGIGGISIGKNSGIASHSMVYSFSHHYRNLINREDTYQYSFTPMARKDQQAMILGPVVIEDYCAVGLNSIILPGSSLKKGAWVASNSIISTSYPAQSLVFYNKNINKKMLNNLQIRE